MRGLGYYRICFIRKLRFATHTVIHIIAPCGEDFPVSSVRVEVILFSAYLSRRDKSLVENVYITSFEHAVRHATSFVLLALLHAYSMLYFVG